MSLVMVTSKNQNNFSVNISSEASSEELDYQCQSRLRANIVLRKSLAILPLRHFKLNDVIRCGDICHLDLFRRKDASSICQVLESEIFSKETDFPKPSAFCSHSSHKFVREGRNCCLFFIARCIHDLTMHLKCCYRSGTKVKLSVYGLDSGLICEEKGWLEAISDVLEIGSFAA